jgi:CRISPR type III-A-associated protein Csm2
MKDRKDQHERNNSLEKIMRELKNLSSMGELSPEKFAPQNGIAYQIAELLRRKEMKFTQLRKFFGELKGIEMEVKKESFDPLKHRPKLLMLMPELAYGVGRRVVSKEFYDIMKICIEKIKNKDDFEKFVEFLTAIIAYYKFLEEVEE